MAGQTTTVRLNAAGYGGTSTTSLTIGTGSKTFTIGSASQLAYAAGSRIRLSYQVTPSDFMEGVITSIAGSSVTFNVDTTNGSGTFAAWNVSIAGVPGAGSQTPWLSDENASGFNLIDAGTVSIGVAAVPVGGQLLEVSATSQPGMVWTATAGTSTEQRGRIIYDGGGAVTGGGWVFQRLTDAGAFGANLLAVIQNTGNVGIGTLSPTHLLQLNADDAAKPSTSTWTVVSDQRVKNNVTDMTEDSVAILGLLRWVRYQYNGQAGTPKDAAGLGLVAQEVQPHLPEAVHSAKGKLKPEDKEEVDLLGLNYHAILVHCARAIQQIDARLKKAGI